MTPRLLERYEQDVLPSLQKQLGRDNRLSLPRMEKIVVNMGVGSAITEKKHLEDALEAMSRRQVASRNASRSMLNLPAGPGWRARPSISRMVGKRREWPSSVESRSRPR